MKYVNYSILVAGIIVHFLGENYHASFAYFLALIWCATFFERKK